MRNMLLESLRHSVSDAVYARGLKYYSEGRVKQFRTRAVNDHQWRIEAVVSGSEDYHVQVQLAVSGQRLQMVNSCDCPYDWEELCKHAVAAIYKFLAEQLPPEQLSNPPETAISSQKQVSKDFDALERLTRNLVEPSLSLRYIIKGLAKLSLANFRLSFNHPQVQEEDLRLLFEYATDSYYSSYSYLYRERQAIINRLSSFDRMVLEHLRPIMTRNDSANRAIFFAKTPENLQFVFTILENRQVLLEESKAPLSKGEAIRPTGYLAGDETKVRIHFDTDQLGEQGIYSPELHYLLAGAFLHPVDSFGIDKLPAEIVVPPERQGELLFEIIPQLQEQTRLEVTPSLLAHSLRVIEPEVRLHFDYRDQKIICEPELVIENRSYQGLDSLATIDARKYSRSGPESREWFTVNRDALENYSRFLTENQFIVSKDGIVLKDPEAIIQFRLTGFRHLPEEWRISTSENFAAFKIEPAVLEPIVEFNPNDDIDWFELKITYNLGGNTYSHQEILAMIRQNSYGEKYIQIDSQIFLIADSAKIDLIKQSLTKSETNSPEQRHELYNLFFYQRFFLENGIRVSGNRIYNQLEEELSQRNLIEASELPAGLTGELRAYQRDGFYWLRFLYQYKLAGILADDMGLGKTVQVLTLIKSLPQGLPVLVVCPRSLLYNWAAEIDKFYPGTVYLVYHGSPEEREALRPQFAGQEIVITTYDMVNRDEKALRETWFEYCILDEAQHIKNNQTQRTQMVKRIKARRRLALTGTPIENNLAELWSIFDFLMPGYLGSKPKFTLEFANPIQKNGDKGILRLLKQKVAPFILRRRKAEVLAELPEKVIMLQKVLMTKLQEDTYRTILAQVRQDVLESISSKGLEKSHITVLAALTRLRQVCNHPRLVLPELDSDAESGKVESLMELVREAMEGRHKMVIFSQFVQMLKIIEEKFREADIRYEYLDGATRDRMERINHFNEDPEIPAFLISLKAGGVGINLTAADVVIHIDPWWNPMTENQATDRVHRIGQRNQVMVYKLIAAGTVEEKMLQLQGRKQSIFDAVIEDNENPVTGLTWEDIRGLFDL